MAIGARPSCVGIAGEPYAASSPAATLGVPARRASKASFVAMPAARQAHREYRREVAGRGIDDLQHLRGPGPFAALVTPGFGLDKLTL